MKEISFPKSKKPLEFRVALLPKEVKKLTAPKNLYFETEYGIHLGISDREYLDAGANICSPEEAYEKNIFCQVRFDYGDVPLLKERQTVFGFLHLVKGDIDANKLITKNATAIAWEHMFKDGKSVFHRNSLLAGRIGARQAMTYSLLDPSECYAAVIGEGMVGSSAIDELLKLGIKMENLFVYDSLNSNGLKKRLSSLDVLMDCSNAKKPFITMDDLKKLKPGALVADLGFSAIEGLETGTLTEPIYFINRGLNRVYKVNNVPSLCCKTASKYISEDVFPYIEMLTKEEINLTLTNAIVIEKGVPIEERLLN